MHDDDDVNDAQTPSNAPPTDETEGVDEAVTPSSTRVKEQDAKTLSEKIAEIERKVADGN